MILKRFEQFNDSDSEMSLFFNIEINSINDIKNLISLGVDINCRNYINNTPLISAAYKNKIKIAEILIDAGADLDLQNSDGQTALIYASLFNYNEIVEMLIDAGANLDLSNDEKIECDTALTIAAYRNNIEVIKMLIKAGADCSIKNYKGKYFFDYLYGDHLPEIIKEFPEKYQEYLMMKNADKYNL